MTETCRAAVFAGDGTYEVREFPVPEPPPGGAVLAVEAVGLCASDVAQLHGHKHVPGEVSPVVPGHEIVGRVHALDPAADLGVRVGQRVAVDLVWRCGTCAMCRTGSPFCERMQLYGYTQGTDVRSGLHGGYGEYMEVLPNSHLLPLTDDAARSAAVAVRAARQRRQLVRWRRAATGRDGRHPGAGPHGPDLRRLRQVPRRRAR